MNISIWWLNSKFDYEPVGTLYRCSSGETCHGEFALNPPTWKLRGTNKIYCAPCVEAVYKAEARLVSS